MKIWEYCIRKPVFTLVLNFAILLLGLFSYTQLGVDLYPPIEPPIVSIQAILPGASPSTIDENVTDVLEDAIATISGIDSIASSSSESRASITVTFDLSKDIDVGAQEIRDAVATKTRELPTDLEPLIIQKLNLSSQAIMWLAISGDISPAQLNTVVEEQVKPALQILPGVGGVQSAGLKEQEVKIWLDPKKLFQLGLTPSDIVNQLRAWQQRYSGGRLETTTTETTIEIESDASSLQELTQFSFITPQGSIPLLQAIDLEQGLEDTRGFSNFLGQPTIGVGIQKQAGENTVFVADTVKKRVAQLAQQLPEGIEIKLASDSSRYIKNSVEGAQFDILLGAFFTAVIIILFIGDFSMSLIAILAIPLSLVGSLTIAYFLGYTLNQMSLLGLALSVGMVIDDAIVVLENIYRHAKTKPIVEATIEGTGEVASAVLSATISIVVIFVPILFLQGFMGQFIGEFAMMIVATILFSLLVSWTLTPLLASRWLKGESGTEAAGILDRPLRVLQASYYRWSKKILRYKSYCYQILGLAFLIFLVGLGVASQLGQELSPDSDTSQFILMFETPKSTAIEATKARLARAEDIILEQPEVQGLFAAVGFFGTPTKGICFVTLTPKSERSRSAQAIISAVMQDIETIPGFAAFPGSTDPLKSGGIGQRSAELEYVLVGNDLDKLANYSEEITQKLNDHPNFQRADTDLELNKEELTISLDRSRLSELGIPAGSLAKELSIFTSGTIAGKMNSEQEQMNIRVQGQPQFRNEEVDLALIPVRTQTQSLVPLSSVTRFHHTLGPDSLNRYNKQRRATISTDLKGITLGEAERLFLDIAGEVLADDQELFQLIPSGIANTQGDSQSALLLSFIMALIAVYCVMAVQFESFTRPFTIMLSLPLATTGVFVALWVTGSTLNLYSLIGIIMLVGIVNRNAILLVDRITENFERGNPTVIAIAEAGATRLRPILMTALSTIFGMLPIALAFSEGGEARAPMGIAVIGGLSLATLLTLIVIPAFVRVTAKE